MVQFVFYEYLSGCAGGIAGVLVGQPLDTIKVRLQTQPGTYRGVWHCFINIWKKESPAGLFKGMSSPLIGLSVINAIVFGVEAQATTWLGKETTMTHFISGAIAGAVQCVICAPMELAKTQMQVQGIGTRKHLKVKYKHSPDVLVQLFKKEGIRGCYRGMAITLLRETPAFACYFASYDILTSTIFKIDKSEIYNWEGISKMLLAGGMAGMASWTITYPADVVKSRLQADGAGGRSLKYTGAWHCFKTILKNEGMPVFFRGLNSCLLRAFPVNAATFAVVDLTSQFLHSRRSNT